MTYHIGKLTDEAKTTITESMHKLLAEHARQANCNPSDLIRDAIYLVFTGISYLDHVANDRRAVMQKQGRALSHKSDTKGIDQ